MPKKTPIKTIQLPGFVGGLNTDADPYQLETNESPDCMNVDFLFRGAVAKRAGYASVSTTQTETNRRIYSWQKQGGTEYLITLDEAGDMWDYTSTPAEETSWTDPTTDDEEVMAIAALNNLLYMTRLNISPKKWDGTTVTAITPTTFDGTSSRFPEAMHLVSAHSRMFAANVDDGGTRHRSRLHFSNLLDPETWDAVDYIDFDPDDGQEITAIEQFGEEIIVFKNHSVQLLAGKSPESFSRYVVDSQLGTVSPRAVVSMGAQLIFFDRDTGVWGFDGSGFNLLSEKINEYLLDGINYDAARFASAFVHRTSLYLSVPWGANDYPSRTFVWDSRTQAWSQYDYGIYDATLHDGAIYAAGVNDAAGVQQLFTGYNDDGAAVEAYVKTPWLAPEGPEAKSRIRRMDMAFSAATADVTVDMYRDFDTAAAYVSQTFTTDPGGSLWDTFKWDIDTWDGASDQELLLTTGWGQRFRTVQFKFSVDAVDEDFQLNKVTLHVSSLGRVRGEA